MFLGIGSKKALGKASISFSLGHIWLSFNVHGADENTSILISIDDMDTLGVYLNIHDDTRVHQAMRQNAPIVRTRGQPFIKWSSYTSCSPTGIELRQLHYRFGHTSPDKLMKVLKRLEIADFGAH